jgi:hypothetical protein
MISVSLEPNVVEKYNPTVHHRNNKIPIFFCNFIWNIKLKLPLSLNITPCGLTGGLEVKLDEFNFMLCPFYRRRSLLDKKLSGNHNRSGHDSEHRSLCTYRESKPSVLLIELSLLLETLLRDDRHTEDGCLLGYNYTALAYNPEAQCFTYWAIPTFGNITASW